MKKILTKIIGASLAIAVMIGGAFGINAAKEAKEVNADSGSWQPSSVGASNGTEMGTREIAAGLTATGALGSNGNGNKPKFYNSSAEVRFYVGNTLTIELTTGTITAVTLTKTAGGFDKNSWTGSAASVTFTGGSTTTKLTKVEVTYSISGGGDTPTTYSVTYDDGDATTGTVPEDNTEYESGDTVTVLGNTGNLAKTDYTFGGWTDGENEYQAGNTFIITSNKTLTAIWNLDEGVDILDKAFTGSPGSYTNWSNKEGNSGAIYSGNSSGDHNSIQLRDSSNSGIVSTTSGGNIRKVSVAWQSDTVSGRTLNIYGKNTAYSSASNLYSESTRGTLLGTIVKGTSTSFTITGDYRYVGLCSNSGAMYLTEVRLYWEEAQLNPRVEFSPSSLTLKTNQTNGAQVTALVEDVQIPTYSWVANDNNVTLVNANSATVTIKPNTNVAADSTVTLTVGGVTPNLVKTLNVAITLPAPGETAETALTVAQAISHIDEVIDGGTNSGNDGNTYFATGIVSEIVEEYNAQYGNITYNISSDGSTESTQLQAYRGKSFGGVKFASEDDIEVGATVIIKGKLTKYGTTYEFAADNELASYTAAPRYTVAFNSLGGSEIQNQSIKKGTCINPLPTPTKAKDTVNQKKFAFEGWYTSANPFEEQNRFTTSTPVNSDLTLYAKYNETNYYVVTFNTNGGNAIDPQEVDSGNTVIMPDNPTKAPDSSYTYTFEGWYKNVGLTESFNASQAITSNLILYAKYTQEAISTPEVYLSSATSVATIHATEAPGESNTISKSINDLADENSWTISSGSDVTCYTNFNLNEKIAVSTTGEANCGSVWGTATKDWRLYQNKSGNVTITAASGYKLSSVTFAFNVSNTGALKLGNAAVANGTPVALDSNTATFTVGNTTSATNGQIRITAISVTYAKALEVSNVVLRFGASISQSDWNAINDNNEHPEWEITDYGVMFLKKDTLDNYGFASVEAAFRANNPLKPVTIKHKGSGEAPYLDNGNYLFTIKVSFPNDTSCYDDVICAAPFIKVNDTYYFLEEKQESVNSLAGYYRTHEGSSLSNDALTYLSTAH